MALKLLLDYLTGQLALVNVPAAPATASGGWGLLLALKELE